MVRPHFVSVGANRVANALDWGDNGLIAYCGHHIICIYDAEAAEVIGTLTGHTGQVNCVKWLASSVVPAGSAVLASGAADNTIRVWAWHGQQPSPPWTCLAQLQGHESPVTSLALQPLSQDRLLLASTSADTHVRLWECSLHSTQQQQQRQQQQQQQLHALFGPEAWQQQPPVHVGRHIQHCVALAVLPEDPDCVLMATGGTDSKVRLFVRDTACHGTGSGSSTSSRSCCPETARTQAANGPQQQQQQQQGGSGSAAAGVCFKLQCQLAGHENWVKGVAFTQVREAAAQTGQQGKVSLLLASAGQDRYGRIWCISADSTHRDAAADRDGAAGAHNTAGAAGAAGGDDVLRKLITRYAPRPHLSAGGHTYWVTLEALLIGHEDWLHSVSWRPIQAAATGVGASLAAAAVAGDAACNDHGSSSCPGLPSRSDLTLLSASQDRSMMLWGYDTPNELWVSDAAIGDAGASCLGFYGGTFNPRGDQLVAHGYTGALHLWRQQQQAAGGSNGRRLWVPQHALGGHYGAVQDIAWGADGACLQSVGTDQTARLFTGINGHWFELARTQVHGHDFSCLATIPSSDSSTQNSSSDSSSSQQTLPPACLMYVSGSEEKVLRVFEATGAFTDSLAAVRILQSAAAAAASAASLAAAGAGSSSDGSSAAAALGRGRALGAAVAALGLSNKALYVDEDGESGLRNAEAAGPRPTMGFESYNEGPDFAPCAVPAVVSGPPLEEHLAQNTLWPEVRKLYGHGNDVFCICSSPSGGIIASACRAQSAGAAAVWVWEVGSWKALAQLPGHTLTVTQLEFSPDGCYLLSGSRDRSFSVWRVPEQYRACAAGPAGVAAAAAAGAGGAAAAAAGSAGSEFVLLGRLKAAHSRIIWSVSWSHDSCLFATGSRDQTVRLWARAGVGGQQPQKPLAVLPPFPAGVTAVALSPQHVSVAAAAAAGIGQRGAQEVHLLAVGCEDGQVQVWQLQLQQCVAEGAGGGVQGADGPCGAAAGQQVEVQQLWCSEPWQQHVGAVRRLRWAPACVPSMCGGVGGGGVVLASCGEDNSVRLFDIAL